MFFGKEILSFMTPVFIFWQDTFNSVFFFFTSTWKIGYYILVAWFLNFDQLNSGYFIIQRLI